MLIVDYSFDYYGSQIKTDVMKDTDNIINLVADNSSIKDFKIHRINKYEEGNLYPYDLNLKHGRLVVEPGVLPGENNA